MAAATTNARAAKSTHVSDLRADPPTLQRAIAEAIFWRDFLGVSPAHGRHLRATDPAYPAAMQVGTNRRAIGEADAAAYQDTLRARATSERAKPCVATSQRAAARSAEVRRAKAKARAEAAP